eukprot:5495717-Pleurochrysis_carterae.AAC.3
MVGVARIRERLAFRIAVSGLGVHGLVTDEAASALVSVAMAAEVRRLLVFGVERAAGQFGLAFCDGELSFVLRGQLCGSERQGVSVDVAAYAAKHGADLHRA